MAAEEISLEDMFGAVETPAESRFNRNRRFAKSVVNNDYRTTLSSQEELEFQKWIKANNVPFDDSPTTDYDMRGFYKALKSGDPKARTGVNPNDNKLHFSDYWKTPYHKSFSNESQWATANAPSWNDKDQLVDKSGKVVFDERASKGISLGDMGLEASEPAAEADKGFFERTWENLKLMNEEGKQEFLKNPLRSYYSLPFGAAKSLLGGMLSMGRASAGGLLGLGSLATGGTFDQGPEAVEKFLESDEKFSKGILYINLAPKTKVEEGFNNLLGLIPESITAVGDTVYEKTGSALTGAGAQGLLTLLTLKPSLAVKPLEGFKSLKNGDRLTANGKKSADQVSSAVEELSVTDPKGVEALKEHVKDADPDLSSLLDQAMKDAQGKPPEAIGEQAAKQPPVQKRGPPYQLADAGNNQLKIVRKDGKWESQPLDRNAAKVRLDELNEVAERNAVLRLNAKVLAEASLGLSKSVEQGMKVLSELPNAPEVKMTPVEREAARKAANEAQIKVLKEAEQAETGKKVIEQVTVPETEMPEVIVAAKRAFEIHQAGITIPGLKVVEGKLREYYDQIIRTVNPEALGPEAKAAASVLAKHIATQMQSESALFHRSAERRGYWNTQADKAFDFLKKFEANQPIQDPVQQRAAVAYRRWQSDIAKTESSLGPKFKSNYLASVFKKPREGVEFLKKRYGKKWNDPQQLSAHQFEMLSEAKKAGHELKTENPEDLMLARQHAADIGEMQTSALRELKDQGIAVPITKGATPPNWSAKEWRAPNGERYWVHDSADAVLHNAFNTQSLWSMPGLGGDLFRGAMFLKNTIVPVKLALSLFHPLHVATIDNATGMVRASKALLSGKISPARFAKEMVESGVYKDLGKETAGQLGSLFGMKPRGGYRLLQAYQGKLSNAAITSADKVALQLMAEGGFIPEMAVQYKTNSIAKLQEAIQRRSATALWHLPFAAISAMQKPMFEIWIPSLKIASYLKDAKTAIQTDPSLMQDRAKRQLALRRLAKSVDNRYGEMAYSTLFWNRWVKDLAVANTLSLGWQMGFLREYGGGMMDLARSPTGKVAKGDFDRPMFVAYYTAQALAYGGLLTWAMTGEEPEGLNDYVYPRTGETLPNGRPERVNTMFYPREFASIYHHVQKEGMVGGLGHLASSKASGVVGMTSEWARGVNDFGEEIRDPDAPAYKQLEQTLAATLEDLQPISVKAIQESTSESKLKSTVLNVSGFSPAPKYVTETKTEGLITGTFRKYFSKTQTPYEKAEYSDDRRKLKKAFDAGDSDKYSEILDKLQTEHELTGMEVRRLERSIARGAEPLVSMFSRLTWRQQKKILDQMTEEEREVYLPAANKEHLRYSYEPPEESK